MGSKTRLLGRLAAPLTLTIEGGSEVGFQTNPAKGARPQMLGECD